ncbi:MAG: L,D-transpeptidase [Deltaproteobacteria bacterium]|nr:L,D-transpeptidase [Deltaproteobacteria bacterium]
MANKVHGGNRRVSAPNPNRRRRSGKKERTGSRLKSAVLPLVFVSVGALGIWQCMDDDAASPLDPVATQSRPVDMGDGREVDPTLLNESSLLENEQLAKPSKADLAEAASGEPVEDRSIEAAGEDLEVDTDAELEAKYPLHGVAYHFHTQIFETPALDARILAYARRGATFRLSERVSKKDCPKGWHEIRGGGYVCDGKGLNVARAPITFEPSPKEAKTNEALPYEYRYVRRNGVAEYWKIPSPEEIEQAKTVFDAIEKAENRHTDAAAASIAPEHAPDSQAPDSLAPDNDEGQNSENAALAAVLAKAEQAAADLAGNTDTGVPDSLNDAVGNEPSNDTDADAAPSGAEPQTTDPLELPAYVHLRMAKGYYVSVNQTIEESGKKWLQTVRGRYIEASELFPASPSAFEGVLLDNRMTLPIAFVVNGGVRKLKQDTPGGPLKNDARVDRYSSFHVRGTIERNNRRYVEVGKGQYLPQSAVGLASVVTPPEDIGETERWIDVNLTEQTLVAYEGHTPVFATLISSGREGFETPTGEFRIYNKHVSITMDDPDAGEESYSIEDVPWTQYFDEGYALHTAFWHDRFGKVRSHGCVNLSPADARRLFYWTGPLISDGVHGVIATKENPGTRVVIHG